MIHHLFAKGKRTSQRMSFLWCARWDLKVSRSTWDSFDVLGVSGSVSTLVARSPTYIFCNLCNSSSVAPGLADPDFLQECLLRQLRKDAVCGGYRQSAGCVDLINQFCNLGYLVENGVCKVKRWLLVLHSFRLVAIITFHRSFINPK